MDFFGIGPLEVLLIVVVALIVFGPGKVVQISRDLGKMVHAFRKASSDLTAQVTRELDLEAKDPSEATHLPPETAAKPRNNASHIPPETAAKPEEPPANVL